MHPAPAEPWAAGPAPEATWARYRSLMLDPEAGATWHAWLAEDALVVVGGQALRKDGLSVEALAEAHRQSVGHLGQGGGFPLPEGPFEGHWQAGESDHQGILWWTLPAPEGEAPFGAMPYPKQLEVGLGFSWDGQAWRLAFSLLSGLVAVGSSWKACRTAAWAEYPYLRSQNERTSRDWLDVAFRRRHRPGTPALRTMEGARFGCHFTGTCCRQTWDITAPPEAQTLLDALPWDEIAPELAGLKLAPREDGMLLVKPQGQSCQFLNTEGHCRIHKRFGTPIFAACTVFPFRFARTPDGVDVVASSHCQSARDNLGPLLADRQVELYQRLGMSPVQLPSQGHRVGPEREVDWASYQQAEAQVLAALERSDLDEIDRLRWALAVAKAWAETGAGPQATGPGPTLALSPVEEFSRLSYLSFFLNAIAVKHEELACARDYLPSAGTRLSPKDQVRAMRMASQLVFAKELAYTFDLQRAMGIIVMLYVFLASLKESAGLEEVSEPMWTLLGTMASHGTIAQRLKVAFTELPFLNEELPKLADLALRHLKSGEVLAKA